MSLNCNVDRQHTAISCLTNSRLDLNHGVRQIMFDAASAVNDAVVRVVAFSLQKQAEWYVALLCSIAVRIMLSLCLICHP